jgi:hypothetical protein
MKVDVVDFLSFVIYVVSFSMITLTKTNHLTNWKCEEHDSVDTCFYFLLNGLKVEMYLAGSSLAQKGSATCSSHVIFATA